MEQQDTLSVHEWSALLSFLELLRQNSSKTELELNKLNLFEQNYVFNSLAFLKSVAHKIHKCKIILQNKSDHYVCLFVDLQNSPLSSETLDFLYTQAQQVHFMHSYLCAYSITSFTSLVFQECVEESHVSVRRVSYKAAEWCERVNRVTHSATQISIAKNWFLSKKINRQLGQSVSNY
jgi:hypothetical protein